jgi:hypothetical protein
MPYRKQARKEWRYDPREDPSHPHYQGRGGPTYVGLTMEPAGPVLNRCCVCGDEIPAGHAQAFASNGNGMHLSCAPTAAIVDEELEHERKRLVGKRVRLNSGRVVTITSVEACTLKGCNCGEVWAVFDGSAITASSAEPVADDKPEVTTFGELSVGERFTCINGISDEVVCRKISDTDREWTNPKYGHNTSETYDHVAVKRVRS